MARDADPVYGERVDLSSADHRWMREGRESFLALQQLRLGFRRRYPAHRIGGGRPRPG